MNAAADRQAQRLADMPGFRRISDVQQQTDGLLARAEETQTEQQAILETSPLASEYSAALAAQIEAKQDQVARIEDRLEGVIERQESRIMQIEARQPGLLALPGQRARWRGQVQQQQALLQRLHTRLENVRERASSEPSSPSWPRGGTKRRRRQGVTRPSCARRSRSVDSSLRASAPAMSTRASASRAA